MINIALMASGAGSNVLNLLSHQADHADIKFRCVIVDNPESPLITELSRLYPNLKCFIIQPSSQLKGVDRRRDFEERLIDVFSSQEIDWILLAGFMRILGETVLSKFEGKIINIHPSLLPKYPGLHAYERAFQNCDEEAGVTIHLVDRGVDTGKILLQRKFFRSGGDTLEAFIHKGKKLEWELYPEVLTMIGNKKL